MQRFSLVTLKTYGVLMQGRESRDSPKFAWGPDVLHKPIDLLKHMYGVDHLMEIRKAGKC